MIYFTIALWKLDIPGPLTSPFRDGKLIVLEHFDHTNNLTFTGRLLNRHTQTNEPGTRNSVVKCPGMSILIKAL
jgi:hypothetical protein